MAAARSEPLYAKSCRTLKNRKSLAGLSAAIATRGVVELEDGDCIIEHLDQAIRAKGTTHEKETPLPDLVLTELTLPKVGGLELLKRLSRGPRYRDFTVAIMAGDNKTSPSSRSQARRAGVVGFVGKRVMKTKLAKMLSDILDSERQEQHDA
jgi:CheY-like chemotaxis protein